MTPDPRDSRRAEGLLLVTAAVWGFAFVAQREGMTHMGPFAFNGARFLAGALLLLLVDRWTAHSARTGLPRCPWTIGALAGGFLFLGASAQQVGLVDPATTAGKAAFITGLYVLFVAAFGTLLGRPPALGTWFGALIAVAGLYLLAFSSDDPDFSVSRGDLLVLLCAALFAGHVLYVDRVSPRYPPLQLAATQFAVCGALSLAVAVATEDVLGADWYGARYSLAYGGLVSVGVGYTLQVVAQRHADPTHASILMSLEALFGAIGGAWLLSEVMSPRQMTGGALMLAGIILSQLLGRRGRVAPASA